MTNTSSCDQITYISGKLVTYRFPIVIHTIFVILLVVIVIYHVQIKSWQSDNKLLLKCGISAKIPIFKFSYSTISLHFLDTIRRFLFATLISISLSSLCRSVIYFSISSVTRCSVAPLSSMKSIWDPLLNIHVSSL